MTLGEIQDRIRQFILENYPAARTANLKDSDPLLERGIIDSLGFLDVVAFLEKQFVFSLDEDDLEPDDFESIEAIASFVHRSLGCSRTQ